MIRLSSNSTIFLKLFVPVFFCVFYGLLSLVIWLKDLPPFNDNPWLIWTNLIFYISTLLIIWRSLFQLHRVEVDSEYFYITDYFRTFKYSIESVEKIEISKILLFKIGKVTFVEKGTFGKSVICLLHKKGWQEYQQTQGLNIK